jgi:geranylgeranyl reductase
VRDESEVNAMLAVSTIKGGIRVGKTKEDKNEEREPALAGK